MEDEILFIFLVGAFFGCLAGAFLGESVSDYIMKKQAVKNNAAHYVLEGDSGGTKFVWGPKP